jgi:hypothetical protein
MTTDRIKEIQAETAYPNSTSVQQALLKVWNECEQEQKQVKNCSIPDVVGRSEQFGDVSENEDPPNNDKPDWNGNCWNQI